MKNQMFFTRALYFSLISLFFYFYRVFMTDFTLSFVSYVIMLAAFLLINIIAKSLNNFRLRKSYDSLEQVDRSKFLNKDISGMSNTMRFVYYASFIFILAISWPVIEQWYGFIYVAGIMGILEYFFNRSQPITQTTVQTQTKSQFKGNVKSPTKGKSKVKGKK